MIQNYVIIAERPTVCLQYGHHISFRYTKQGRWWAEDRSR